MKRYFIQSHRLILESRVEKTWKIRQICVLSTQKTIIKIKKKNTINHRQPFKHKLKLPDRCRWSHVCLLRQKILVGLNKDFNWPRAGPDPDALQQTAFGIRSQPAHKRRLRAGLQAWSETHFLLNKSAVCSQKKKRGEQGRTGDKGVSPCAQHLKHKHTPFITPSENELKL